MTLGRATTSLRRLLAAGSVPGEVVWTFLPDDDGRLRDQPVLVLGRLGPDLLALSPAGEQAPAGEQDHGRAVHHPEPADCLPAELRALRLDRVLALAPRGTRRDGTVVDGPTLRGVVAAWRAW